MWSPGSGRSGACGRRRRAQSMAINTLQERQEERLAGAVVEFAASLKNQARVCARIACRLGVDVWAREPVNPGDAEKLLEKYETDQAIHFERILLLSSAHQQKLARAWQQAVWDLSDIKS